MKTLISFLFIATVLFSCKEEEYIIPPVADELLAPANGKMVHYLFNNSLRDTSGNNNHGGGASGGVGYAADRFGRANRSVIFNGTSGSFEGKGMKTPFPFAVSVWTKTSTPLALSTLIRSEKNPGDPQAYTGFWLQTLADGKLAFSFGDGTAPGSTARNSIIGSQVLAANQWYHIVVNVTGANSMELYLNGVKDNSTLYDGAATTMVYTFSDPTALMGQGFGGQFFNGNMDDLKIYNRLLTATEITTLYNFTP